MNMGLYIPVMIRLVVFLAWHIGGVYLGRATETAKVLVVCYAYFLHKYLIS